MALIVQKFGGSSVADSEHIKRIANIIARTRQQGHDVVAVVSAMLGDTDRLIRLAHHFPECNAREYDALLSTGEQISAALLSMCLESMGHRACSLNGAQIKVVTTSDHKKARIIEVETTRLCSEIQKGYVPVITGFQGISTAGDITTLGRGGSDLTAVALANTLNADECQIFTDVEGVYTADPKVVANACRIKQITFDEMLELASLGAKVLQTRCLEYAGKYKVPLRVLSSKRLEGEGTLISYATGPSTPKVSGVALDRQQAQITLQGVPRRPGLMSYLLGPLSQANIETDMIVQNMPDAHRLMDLSFTLHQDDLEQAQKIIAQLVPELGVTAVLINAAAAKLSLVGIGLSSHAAVASRMLKALGQEGIEVHLFTTSEMKISAIIDEKFSNLGARALHQVFQLNNSHKETLPV